MAHFYAEIQGNRGQASRMGTKATGIRGHIRGWRVGIRVDCHHCSETGNDVCTVSVTGGSGRPSGRPVLRVVEGLEPVLINEDGETQRLSMIPGYQRFEEERKE